mmetsp:Transcript_5254/g.5390  ORF Transcript_5254/g.5390 Transcript_5254/m.5390 type:complete len:560 (-) Transcript_5254:286-1965(-)|eukprot:CAMPEP_0182431658 /NCGR_PEP_ID=MMETSP1167-20130531/50864_1 /TAXON_ID=2988 /ORGANISM="Mallomonas Sp, Strain CCMP3275" /LENGTH=559 /DNA_ID=CAMNT_0024618251 /DNA_START=69 /DNA_END=1748 /DNA_ORIENTATION=+
MENILPAFKTFSVDKPVAKPAKNSNNWVPISKDKPVPYYLEPACSKDYSKPPKVISLSQAKPPNERYKKELYDGLKPSPLSTAERGLSEPTLISLPPPPEELETKLPDTDTEVTLKPLGIRVYNKDADDLELFYPLRRILSSVTVSPQTMCCRAVSSLGTMGSEMEMEYLEILHTPAKRVIAECIKIEDLKTFDFTLSAIGVEVEMSEGKLLVSKVFEGSQASEFGNELLEAEIVAVNGQRVVTLEEFEERVLAVREQLQTSDSKQHIVSIQTVLAREHHDVSVSTVKTAKMFLQQMMGDLVEEDRLSQNSISVGEDDSVQSLSERETDRSTERGKIIENEDGEMVAARRQSSIEEAVDTNPLLNETDVEEEFRQKAYNTHQLVLICVPPAFIISQATQRDVLLASKKLFTVANLSSRWLVRVYCVSVSGVLVSRAALRSGERHSEWTGSNHVWCIFVETNLQLETGFGAGPTRLTEWEEIHKVEYQGTDGALALLLRPCASSLIDSKTNSLLWTPWMSLSISQRPRVTPAQKKSQAALQSLVPHLSLQVLDGSKSNES